MTFGTTGKGQPIVMINKDVYLSFGKDPQVKWIHLSYPVEKGGSRGGEMFKPDMTGLSKDAKKVLGNDNVKVLKTVFKTFLKDGIINSIDLPVIGAQLELKGI